MDVLLQQPKFAERLYDVFPVTTALSNPGSTLPNDVDGILFRGASINLPLRLLHVGTFWGMSTIQKEVIPIDNVPTVRPMLPITLVFDHRLIDGVKASELLLSVCKCIQDPASIFGKDGRLPPAISVRS